MNSHTILPTASFLLFTILRESNFILILTDTHKQLKDAQTIEKMGSNAKRENTLHSKYKAPFLFSQLGITHTTAVGTSVSQNVHRVSYMPGSLSIQFHFISVTILLSFCTDEKTEVQINEVT